MVDIWMNREPITVVFAVKSETEYPVGGWTPKAGSGYSGSAIVTSITANAADNDNATYSITLEGAGALTKVTTA